MPKNIRNPMGVDNFEFTLLPTIRGYFSSIDPTLASANTLIRGSQNVYKTANDTWANRPGRKLYDAVDTTVAGTKAAFVWKTSLAATIPVRIANAKFQILSDITGTKVWYTLLSSLTKTRGVFDAWWNNTLKKDQLIFVIGDTTLYMWHGGIGKIASTTATTVVLNASVASLGFNTSSGSVLINGTTYTYTGSSASTLTGVTPDPTGEAVNSAVISTVVQTATTPSTDSTTFTNDFIRVIGNQLHVGSYLSRLIYISSLSDYTSFTATIQSNSRTPGSSELLVLDNPAKGIGVRLGQAHIFAGTSDLYKISFNNLALGSTLTQQTIVDKIQLSNLASAYSHEMIDQFNDTVYYLGQDQQLRAFGTFRNINTSFPILLSSEVSTDLFNEDFTLGQLKVISTADLGDLVYITSPNNGVTYIYQNRTGVNSLGNVISERLWFSPFVWGLSRIDIIGTSVVGFSNSNPQVYTLWETLQWFDDGPSGNLAYTSILLTAYRQHKRRQGKVRFDKVYSEGYISQGTSLFGGVYYDYQGASGILSTIIHSVSDGSPAKDASFATGVIPPSLGDSSLGDNPLGDGTAIINFSASIRDRDTLPKFRIINDVQVIDCFEYSLLVYSTRIDSRWELITIGVNASESPFSAAETRK